MSCLARSAYLCALVLLGIGASTTAAHAYLDPGTGSMILQLVLGGVAGLLLAGKLYWQKLVSMLGFKREPAKVQQTAD
ncbi:MAG: hypothetical protein AB7I59_22205 [Geminicoccaceae bacterium]